MTKQELYKKACMLPLLPGVYIIRDKTEMCIRDREEKLGTARRTEAIRADLARLEELVSEVRVCNTGLFEPDTRVQRATEEMLTIIHRLDTQEELPDGI